jgi:magnesium chelatase subunit I
MATLPDHLPDLEVQQPPEGYVPSALLHVLNKTGARTVLAGPEADLGLAESLPFPFLALVGQLEMRIALLLSVINPAVGGVLLIGPRGTGKTTAVRSLSGVLPDIEVSTCPEGCLPEDYQRLGTASVCAECADKLARGLPITRLETVKMIELPLNARLEDVVGGINERIAVQQNRVRLERGILAHADQNLLYIDEVNLLDDTIADAILDAASAGMYTVRRGPMVGMYRSRFVLIGSMNPEEGSLRPQIMDRFGLRVAVRGLMNSDERLEVYRRVRAYRDNPRAFIREWAGALVEAREEVSAARKLLTEVELTDKALAVGLQLVKRLDIDSHRAEYTMFEAARAHAAADGRDQADVRDVQAVALMALRQRRSQFMVEFFHHQQGEDSLIREQIGAILAEDSSGSPGGADDSA